MAKPKEITGNTLKIYLYLVAHGPSELREIQRGLNLSTPSLVSYHLNKLMEAKYVEQDRESRYVAIKESSTEILEGYSKVGTALVPQLFFFAILFTILTAFFSYQAYIQPSNTLLLIAVSIAMVILLWYETMRLWRRLVVEMKQ
jgi:DNA-binding transcriptional ArsR family regulator